MTGTDFGTVAVLGAATLLCPEGAGELVGVEDTASLPFEAPLFDTGGIVADSGTVTVVVADSGIVTVMDLGDAVNTDCVFPAISATKNELAFDRVEITAPPPAFATEVAFTVQRVAVD